MIGQGNITFSTAAVGKEGFSIPILATTSAWGSNLTRFFAAFSAGPFSTANDCQIPILVPCTIEAAYIVGIFSTAGSAQAWSFFVRVNNTTDHLISTVAVSATRRVWSNAALSIDLNPGDTVLLKTITPVYTVNPSITGWSGNILLVNR